MSVVDLVVVFGEDTPIPLLEKLRPDVLIKGGDYSAETVVGADLVTGYGGQVRLTGFLDGHSSTAVIARAGGGE
jgi:D-beta-D-heptose 7-phosphate kinase/D-beta-D-heptose 1-phosphate adenosyltransferase